MKLTMVNGVLSIDSKPVQVVIFTDGSTMRFPIDDDNVIEMDTNQSNKTDILGSRNTVIQGKNIVSGNITCKGDFRVGDG